MRKRKTRILCIDADSSVYACGFKAEHKHWYCLYQGKVVFECENKNDGNKWAKTQEDYPIEELTWDCTVTYDTLAECLAGVKGWVRNQYDFSGCSRKIITLTKGGADFRSKLATIQRYKGNRMSLTKPYYYEQIREYLIKYHQAKVYAKWEADDAVTMCMHTNAQHEDKEYILAAIDKDLNQVEGKRFNPNKREEGVYTITAFEGWYSFYHQMLTGDSTDNIRGLSGTKEHPGIGKAAATKLLAKATTEQELFEIVLEQYRLAYGEEPITYTPWWWEEQWDEDEEALLYRKTREKEIVCSYLHFFRENADLLYMLRTPDDQYTPPVAIKGWDKYPHGTVKYYLEELI